MSASVKTSAGLGVVGSATARRRLRYSSTDFAVLDELFGPIFPRMIVRGEGAFLYDSDGRRLLDGGVHLGACQVGHGRPEMVEAIAAQAAQLSFVSADQGYACLPAVELADTLAVRVPVDDAMLWFSTSGSEANELAFKLARAYWRACGESIRTKILSRDGSYHGSAFGGVSANGVAATRNTFSPLVPGFSLVGQPWPPRCAYCDGRACSLACADDVARTILREGPDTIAAIIAEPISIIEAVKVPADGYWQRLRSICDEYGVLLIADEVVTGFGRTGRLFGLDHWGVRADIVTMAKGITSGYVPLGAVAVSRAVCDVIGPTPVPHINTYANHPIACAAALRNLELLDAEELPARAAALQPVIDDDLRRLAERHPVVARTSVSGLLASIEFADGTVARTPAGFERLRVACYERGLIVRGYPGSLFFYPPLIVSDDDIAEGFAALDAALAEAAG